MGVEVVGNRVLVAPDAKKTTTTSGLILPDRSVEESTIGTVVAIGSGDYHQKTGRWMPIRSVDVGDRVLYSKYGGTVIEVDGEEMLLIKPEDIYCIVDVEVE